MIQNFKRDALSALIKYLKKLKIQFINMKSLEEYINEAAGPKGWLTSKKGAELYKGLLIDDRERIQDIERYLPGHNTIPAFEEIEQLFWNGEYKDRVDDYFDYVTGWLKDINLTPNDIITAYGLTDGLTGRSGKQSKIDVIVTVIRAIISYLRNN